MTERGQITDPAAALQFIRGGNATFTLESLKTGQHFTFKVQAPSEETERGGHKRNLAGPRFVKLLIGPSNEDDYAYIGMLYETGFRTTKASKVKANSPSVMALDWAIGNFVAGHMPSTLAIYHDGRCCVCGRKLTVPSSIASGIGPECASKGGF